MVFTLSRFFLLVILLILPVRLYSLEPDPYLIWTQPKLDDSTVEVNQFLNAKLLEFLSQHINVKKKIDSKFVRYQLKTDKIKPVPLACSRIAWKYLDYLRPHFFKNLLTRFYFKNQNLDIYPRKKHFFHDYNQSIYHGFVWPFLMPIAQMVKINNVYLGTDKLSHFFASGRRYYKVYLRELKKGKTPLEAEIKAIDMGLGFKEEKGILGLWSSGIFSYADLETNYQGMRLAIDMCEGDNPYLGLDGDGNWQVKNQIDIRKYVSSLWDESYNSSYYAGYRKKKAYQAIVQKYCQLGLTSPIKKIWGGYSKQLFQNTNTDYLKKMMDEGKIPNPQADSLASICGYPPGVMEGVPFFK